MRYLARFSPFTAIRDLRLFLAQRKPYELWFGILSIMITGLLLVGFALDSREVRPYKPNIVYVQQWRADRTDAQITAQQKIDQVAIDRRQAEIDRRRKAMQAQFKRIDDRLTKYGL